jgi:hypothetical protein
LNVLQIGSKATGVAWISAMRGFLIMRQIYPLRAFASGALQQAMRVLLDTRMRAT